MILPLLMLIMFCITNLESIDPLSHLLLAFGSYYIVTGVGEKDMVTLSQTQSEKEKVKHSKEREKRRRRRRSREGGGGGGGGGGTLTFFCSIGSRYVQ